MANYGPSTAWLVVGGYDVTGDIYDLEEQTEQVLEETHPFLGGTPDPDNVETWIPVGIAKVTLNGGQGLYDTRTAGQLAAFQETGATKQLVAWGKSGSGVGAEASMANGTYVAGWTRKADHNAIILGQAKHTITGSLYRGRLVAAFATLTGDTGDTKSTPFDQEDFATSVTILNSNADDSIETSTPHGLAVNDDVFIAGHSGSTPAIAGWYNVLAVIDSTNFTLTGVDITVGGTGGTVKQVSSAGCTLDLHVPVYVAGGASDVVILCEHSDDAASWSTLATFTAVTAAGADQRIVVAAGTQVKRYLALSWNFTGGGGGSSIKPVLAVYRTE